MRRTLVRSVLSALVLALLPAGALSQSATASPHKAVYDRLQSLTVAPVDDWRFHPGVIPHGEDPGLADADWKPYRPGEAWQSGPAWLRASIVLPATNNGYGLRGSCARLLLSFDGDDERALMIYVNGELVSNQEDPGPIVLAQQAKPGARYLVAVKVLVRPVRTFLRSAWLQFEPPATSPHPNILRAEMMTAEALAGVEAEGKDARLGVVDDTVKAVDWAALDKGNQALFDASLRKAHDTLLPLRAFLQRYAIRATGNSHIDMAWLWPWTETVDVVKRTFGTALQLMLEYPDMTFTMAQAQAYAWMEEKYPPLFTEIQQRVKEGRWEVLGGMWVEPDLNLPDGEALVRQLLYGKRYFKSRFGIEVRTGWNPDSFGYNWQLPQIYKKSGIDAFVTQKIYWNDTTRFPHKLFWWQAPDGTRVLAYFPHDYANDTDPLRMASDLAEYAPAMRWPEMMHLFGVGDHGGGPTRAMLDTVKAWQSPDRIYPKLGFGTAQPYFDTLATKVDTSKLPVWNDELYLEYHRGVQTTQARNKKNNRTSEQAMLTAEKLASIASLFGRPYPRAELEAAWKKVLFNQFHDILPGSSINAVYKDNDRDHAEVRRIAGGVTRDSLEEIALRVATAPLPSDRRESLPLLVFNALSWPRVDVVEAEVPVRYGCSGVTMEDASGQPVLMQEGSCPAGAVRTKIRFLAEGVPGLGYKLFRLVRPTLVKGKVGSAVPPATMLTATADTLENELLRVKVDRASGCLTSLFDKRTNREALAAGACGNLLQAFRDTPKEYDAWNIDADFEKEMWDIRKAESVTLLEGGPLRAAIRVVRRFQGSTFTQDITLYPRIARVDVVTEADWHEKHILVKAAFPVSVNNDKATFEIPYGSIERPTTRRTPEEKAKFEVPAQRWADLSDAAFGLSFLNDCKYGYDARDNVLRLSLLRSPEWPDPFADQGVHRFTYAFFPHAGGWREAGTVRAGYELNYRLIPMVTTGHEGTLPAVHSFVEVQGDSVILHAVKKAEDEDALVLRFYEWAGRAAPVKMRLAGGIARAAEIDLQEKEIGALATQGDELPFTVKPYEIKSVKVVTPPRP